MYFMNIVVRRALEKKTTRTRTHITDNKRKSRNSSSETAKQYATAAHAEGKKIEWNILHKRTKPNGTTSIEAQKEIVLYFNRIYSLLLSLSSFSYFLHAQR